MSTTAAQPKLKRKSAMLNLFVSPKEINKLKADLQLRQNRRKPPLPTTSPDPPKPTSPTPTPTAPAEPTPPTPWTTAEDIAILHLKGTGKTFAEIATSLSPRTEPEIETRFKEIGLPATTAAAEGAADENAATEPAKAATTTTNEGKGAGGKAQKSGKQKNEGNKQKSGGNTNPPGGKKGKGKAAEPSTTPAAPPPPTSPPDADNEPTDPFTDPTGASAASLSKNNEAIIANKRDQKVRGILKRGVNGTYSQEEIVIPFGATSINGRPIIYIEENDPLGVEDLSTLYHMHMGFEEQRWIRMASKFFDQTGKRIEPEWLKGKLGHCRL